jgi:hypothetical protein
MRHCPGRFVAVSFPRPPRRGSALPCPLRSETDDVFVPLLIGAMMIVTSIVRLYFIRSGKVVFVFGFQRYFPWVFMIAGIAIILATIFGW